MYHRKHAEGSAAGTVMHVGRSITMKHMLVREIMYAVLLGDLRGSFSLRNMSLECEADLDFDPCRTRRLNFSVVRTEPDLFVHFVQCFDRCECESKAAWFNCYDQISMFSDNKQLSLSALPCNTENNWEN